MSLSSRLKKEVHTMVVLLIQEVWKRMNDIIFNGVTTSIMSILLLVRLGERHDLGLVYCAATWIFFLPVSRRWITSE